VTGTRRSVVVTGVDGSASSAAALLHACDLARAPGVFVMVTAWPGQHGSSWGRDSVVHRAGHRWAVEAQTAAVAQLRRSRSRPPPLTGLVLEGAPAEVLARAGGGAAGIVLGRRTEDGLTDACNVDA